MLDRRSFLGSLGAALALAARPGAATRLLDGRKIRRVGLQLYTVRDAMKRDVAGTLARVAKIGYREVEFAGYFDKTPAQIRALLAQDGLTSPSAHIPYANVGSNWARSLDDAKTIGHEWVTIPWLDEGDRKTLDDWKRVAATFNRAAEQAHAAGLRFAYHNHWFEFAPVNGQVPYDLLLRETDPKLVDFEMDLYWITKAGGDPLAYFAKYPGRFKLVHAKDSKGPPQQAMADVGSGVIDFRKIFAHSRQAGIQHYFVERDDAPDPFASIAASQRYLARLTF